MASLTGRSVASSYKDLLQVSNSNSGIDGTARVVSDGEDTASKLFLDTNRVGVGIAPTDGTLHVHTASAGVVDAPSVTDDLIVENNDHAGIQILSPDDKFGTLGFGSPADAIAGMVRYDETNKTMIFGTVEGTNAGNIKFVTANEVTAMTIDSNQKIAIGHNAPSSTLHVKSTSADGYIIAESSEANSNGILEARSVANRDSYLMFREGTSLKAQIFNDASEDSLVLTDGANSNTVFIKSDNVGIGGDPSNKLDVFSAGDAVLRVKSTTNSSGNDAIFLANVAGSSGGDPMMRFNIDSVGAWSIGVDNDDSDKFKISGLSAVLGNNDRLVIDTSGSLGIGSDSPNQFVEIKRASRTTAFDAGDSDTWVDLLVRNPQTQANSATGIAFQVDSAYHTNGSTGICAVHGTGDYEADMAFITRGNAVPASEKMRLTSGGSLGIGVTTMESAGGGVSRLQVEGTTHETSSISITRNANSANAGYLTFSKSRGTSVNSDTIVQDGDAIGSILFAPADGTDRNSISASILGAIDGTPGSNDVPGRLVFSTASDGANSVTERMRITSSGNILPGTDDAQDLGSSSKRFDDIHATNGTIQTSDERLKDNIADSSLGLDFVNALRPVKYKWKDYSYDVEKEKAIEAKEAEYETVVVQEAVEAKEAVMGTRQKTVSKEVEKTKTEIVEEDGKYVQKEVSYTETVKEPQYEEVNLYDEDGNKIQRLVSEAIEAVEGVEYQEATYYTEDDELPEGKEVGDIKTEEIQAVEAVEAKDAVYEDVLHKIPVMEEYEVEPAIEAVEEVTEERLVSEAIEAKDAVMETKEKTFARTHFGLIAQEVEQVLKDSSLTNNDFAGLIYDEDADRYGIRYSELIAPLIKAVQELSKKVNDLENK